MLLGGTAATALSINQPASAIVIRDDVAAAFGGIENYYDKDNQYPNVVKVVSDVNSCTGSLIDSRTILTAAHCLFGADQHTPVNLKGVSFQSDGSNLIDLSGSKPHASWSDPENDIALISLAQPVRNLTSVKPLLMLQPGQPGFPTVGTTIIMVGYGLQGTGSSALYWVPNPNEQGNHAPQPGDPTLGGLPLREGDGLRRVGESSLGAYVAMNMVPKYQSQVSQYFFFSQFRDPKSPDNPNDFNLPPQVPVRPLEAITGPGDSGGPLFAVIGGQLVQIGVVRGGSPPPDIKYCVEPGEDPEEVPPVKCDSKHTVLTGVVRSNG
jgi:subtilase-type serine protease